jgi:5-formyltetrahydrofolate cyclo-ligase
MNPSEAKAVLRKRQLAALREIPLPLRAQWSQQILTRLLATDAWQAATTVMIYAPMANEPDLLPLLATGKRLIFPKVTPDGLTLHEVSDAGQLMKTTGWLREPNVTLCPQVRLEQIELVTLPGLAFARQTGVRLGRGGGYYDRLLGQAEFRAQAIGVCFQCQVVDTLPKEDHDLTVGQIVTEAETICVPVSA